MGLLYFENYRTCMLAYLITFPHLDKRVWGGGGRTGVTNACARGGLNPILLLPTINAIMLEKSSCKWQKDQYGFHSITWAYAKIHWTDSIKHLIYCLLISWKLHAALGEGDWCAKTAQMLPSTSLQNRLVEHLKCKTLYHLKFLYLEFLNIFCCHLVLDHC